MFEFELPDLGEGVAEGEVLAWHVAAGDGVSEDDVLAEVETDKAAVDVPSPVDGVVRELHAEVGEIVATGEVLVSIEETEGEPATAEAKSGSDDEEREGAAGDGRVFAPPSVRRFARETGVDLTTVSGSGPSGRITESDVEAAAGASDDGPTAVVSTVEEDDNESEPESDDGPTSVVSKVDDESDSGPKSVISRVSDDAEKDDEADSRPTVVVDTRDDDGDAAGRANATATMAEPRDTTLATPATRQLARELGVDIDAVPTDETRDGEPYVDAAAVRAVAGREGRSGEITDEDVREVTEQVVSELRGLATERSVETREGDRREPYRGVRRRIGERMARSRREVPHATHHDIVAVPGLVEARERLQPLAEERGVELTYTPLLAKCVAAALDDHPRLATQLDTEREEIRYRSDRDLGVATATDHGLVVPVVETVGEKGLLELADELTDLVERARNRDIAPEEMQGGVFTVTNFGAIGGEYADPIITVPEPAILGVGALKERAVVDGGEVVAEPTLPLSLSIDHRVIDGADAARFVNTLKEYLADPTRLLLD